MTTAANQWYLHQKGKLLGPLTDDALHDMAAQGRVSSDDYLWREGLDLWVLAKDMPGLLAARRDFVAAKGGQAKARPDKSRYGGTRRTENKLRDRLNTARPSPAEIAIPVPSAPPSASTNRPGADDTGTAAGPWSTDPATQRRSRRGGASGGSKAVFELPVIGAVKPITLLLLLLGVVIPLWPLSLIFFWWLAYRSHVGWNETKTNARKKRK